MRKTISEVVPYYFQLLLETSDITLYLLPLTVNPVSSTSLVPDISNHI